MKRKGATQMTTLAALFVLLATPCAAQDAPVQYLPEPDFETIVQKTVEPLKAKDAFHGLEECAVVDARTIAPVTLAKAEEMIAPCVTGLGRRYGAELVVQRLAAAAEGDFAIQVEGLAIYVPAETAVTSPLMKDINRGLALRKGKILGHRVALRRGPAPSANKPGPEKGAQISAAQGAIDRCVMTAVVRQIDSSEDFLKHYGGCLMRAPELKVREMRPAPGQKLTVALLSLAEEKIVQSLTGRVSVPGADGPVNVSLVAYPQVVSLP
jgi:hypothetical protein